MNSIIEILRKIQERHPKLKSRLAEARAVVLWPEAVGPQIAKHARAVRVWDRVLWLEIDHPAWRSEILFRKNQILDRLNTQVRAEFPELTDSPIIDIRALDPKGNIPPKTFSGQKTSPSPDSTPGSSGSGKLYPKIRTLSRRK